MNKGFYFFARGEIPHPDPSIPTGAGQLCTVRRPLQRCNQIIVAFEGLDFPARLPIPDQDLPSLEPLAKYWPWGEKEMALIAALWPVRVRMSWPSAARQILIVLSSLPLAK